ncbi:MAG: serine/threonine protein kinase, partial [Deltaproteobacteria bacterium]|nr:serine/threonine protein kinase [Deltaproteobacteria bacterium]
MTDNLTGQILDKKYLIKDLLGEGGMGAVYHGEHISMGKRVAVKFLHSSFISNEEVVKRFFREARAAASISHRNIIDVMDMGVSPGGEPYLVMEYLVGIDLDTVLEKKGRLNLSTAVAIMDFALQAIGAAHQKGIVHRDLKPENIYISLQNGEEPEIKLIDFGISKFEDKNTTKLTVEGTTLGTPAYMSPEQARGSKDLNYTTDIYSTGVILYQLLSGSTPFAGENYNELLVNILTSEPQSPDTVCNDFPMEIWPVIQKAISKQPGDRYESAEELRKVLKSFSDDQKNKDALYDLGQFIKNEVSSSKLTKSSAVKIEGKSAEAILSELVQDTIAVNSAEALSKIEIKSQNISPSAPIVEAEKKKRTELVVKIPIPSKETVLKTKNAVEKNSITIFHFLKYLGSLLIKLIFKIKYLLFDSPQKKAFRITFAILAAIPIFLF